MHAVQVAQVAASEGDRVARSFGGGPSAGTAAAEGVLGGPGSDVTGATVSVSVLPGDSEWLQVSGHALSILPGLTFSVSASATGPIQQFREIRVTARPRPRPFPTGSVTASTVPVGGWSDARRRGSLTVELVVLTPVLLRARHGLTRLRTGDARPASRWSRRRGPEPRPRRSCRRWGRPSGSGR